ncbi:MAG: DEAD/DEAH box helicase [Lachnospiraceae bacterium]|nr:DEAD/DEAH box helicase [Lachnospiraceae bacterium]MBQ8947962.1 DEAD/DEAH box helicase [Lachnospiraceae bacterium]
MQARDYQIKARDAIHDEWAQGRTRTMMVLPTGCGKTIVAAGITKDQVDAGERVLFVAHRGELLTQAMDKIKSVSGIDCALEKAENTSVGSLFPVTVGSIQTLCWTSRLERFEPDHFGTIIVDEAHHVMSDSYQVMLDYFGGAKVLGMTATADRADKKSLSEFFDSCAFEYSMRKAITDGYLVPIKAQMIPLELDLTKVKMSQGDYSLGDTAHALEPYLEQIAEQMTKYCMDRKTVVFLPLVKISQEFTAILNRCGFNAIEVNGNSPDREQILADFDAGYYNVLCNSMLLTESSLREFANIKPVNFWFKYPVHVLDGSGELEKMGAEGSQKGNLSKSSKRVSPEERMESIYKAFEACSLNEPVTVKDMAKYLDVSERTIRTRVGEMENEFYIKSGFVFEVKNKEKGD